MLRGLHLAPLGYIGISPAPKRAPSVYRDCHRGGINSRANQQFSVLNDTLIFAAAVCVLYLFFIDSPGFKGPLIAFREPSEVEPVSVLRVPNLVQLLGNISGHPVA
jgi:hypothetical protein